MPAKSLAPIFCLSLWKRAGERGKGASSCTVPAKAWTPHSAFRLRTPGKTGFEAIRNKGFDWRSILAGNFAIFAIRAFATIASSLRAFTALARLATTVFGSALRRPAFPTISATITTTTVWTAVSAAISTIASFTPVYAALTTTIRGALATTI